MSIRRWPLTTLTERAASPCAHRWGSYQLCSRQRQQLAGDEYRLNSHSFAQRKSQEYGGISGQWSNQPLLRFPSVLSRDNLVGTNTLPLGSLLPLCTHSKRENLSRVQARWLTRWTGSSQPNQNLNSRRTFGAREDRNHVFKRRYSSRARVRSVLPWQIHRQPTTMYEGRGRIAKNHDRQVDRIKMCSHAADTVTFYRVGADPNCSCPIASKQIALFSPDRLDCNQVKSPMFRPTYPTAS